LAKLINKRLIFLQGRGLGGAVAAYMANECPQLFRGLIIENTFTSFSDMLNDLFYAPFWVRKFITIQWNTYKYVSDLKMPILYTTGDSDEIIPYDYTLNLYKLSK